MILHLRARRRRALIHDRRVKWHLFGSRHRTRRISPSVRMRSEVTVLTGLRVRIGVVVEERWSSDHLRLMSGVRSFHCY